MKKRMKGSDIDTNVGDIAKAIKLLRKSNGMTQQELGNMVGLNKQAICHIEKGDTVPPLRTLIKICHSLGAKISVVFDLSSIKSNKELRNGDTERQLFAN